MEGAAAWIRSAMGDSAEPIVTALLSEVDGGFMSKHRDTKMEDVRAWLLAFLDVN